MRLFILTLVFLAWASVANALQVCWDQVTVDAAGDPLSAGMEVNLYQLWTCNNPAANCLKPDAHIIGQAIPPFPALPAKVCVAIDGLPIPSTYFAVATNIAVDSPESDTVKVAGPGRIKNIEVK